MTSIVKGGRPPRAAAWTGAAVALVILAVLAGQPKVAELIAAALVGYGLAKLIVGVSAHWTWLLYLVAAVDLLIPEDGRYTLKGAGAGGFQMEPYRVLITIMIAGWIAGLLVDPRVRARLTKFDGPLMLITFAVVGSEVFNPSRVDSLSSYVVKAIVLFISLLLFIYVVASVIRTRETIDRLFKVLVVSGCVVALAALVERVAKFNVFNHLHKFLPFMDFNSGAELSSLLRNGHFRTIASAGHPIELSNNMAMLTPIAAYVAIRAGKKWWTAVFILLLGNFTTGSRTGIVGLIVVLIVFLCLRPKETLKCWPAVIPLLIFLQLALPGAISGTIDAFFPKGGLIAQQSETFAAHGQVQQASRLSRVGPQLRDVWAAHNEFFGEGYGTRIVGRTSLTGGSPTAFGFGADNAQILDDQWLGNVLDIGLVGFAAWLWLFTRVIRRLAARAKLERGTPEGWLPVALTASIACFAVSMYFYDALSFMQGTVIMYLLLGCASALLWMPPARKQRARPSVTGRLIMPRLVSSAAAEMPTVGLSA